MLSYLPGEKIEHPDLLCRRPAKTGEDTLPPCFCWRRGSLGGRRNGLGGRRCGIPAESINPALKPAGFTRESIASNCPSLDLLLIKHMKTNS